MVKTVSRFLGPTKSCILYDDENLDGREGFKEMDNGDEIPEFEKQFGFDVESLFVKKGCQLDAYTGIYNFSSRNFSQTQNCF